MTTSVRRSRASLLLGTGLVLVTLAPKTAGGGSSGGLAATAVESTAVRPTPGVTAAPRAQEG
ncbi:MAG: hypothetical protein M3303_08770, partial [Gemmatimonadota bacterium]|nr:hypothetical protein [Gemmatimonadota bacterium]